MPHQFWTEDPGCVVGAFYEHLSSGMVREFHDVVRAHAASPRRSCVGYICPGTVTSRGALKAIGTMLTDSKISMGGWVCCIGGTGFWAATGRGMAASVMLAIKPTAPVHIPATMQEAVRWLEEQRLPAPAADVQAAVLALT